MFLFIKVFYFIKNICCPNGIKQIPAFVLHVICIFFYSQSDRGGRGGGAERIFITGAGTIQEMGIFRGSVIICGALAQQWSVAQQSSVAWEPSVARYSSRGVAFVHGAEIVCGSATVCGAASVCGAAFVSGVAFVL